MPQCAQLTWPQDLTATARALSAVSEFVWLDADSGGAGSSSPRRESYIAVNPCATLEQAEFGLARFVVRARSTTNDPVGRLRPRGAAGRSDRCVRRAPSAWELWRSVHERLPPDETPGPGWFGFVGFETITDLERVPTLRRAHPGIGLFRMSLYDAVFVLDHDRRSVELRVSDTLAPALGAAPASFESLADVWEAACRPSAPAADPAATPTLAIEVPRHDHESRVRRAVEYIAAGDVYQVNLSHRLRIDGLPAPFATYARLRSGNAAPYAAYVQWPGAAIASVSPELFLDLRGCEVRTRPIKGTRPRTGDPAVDAQSVASLLASDKEAAELAMIVDLHRNDLGRVCEFGSVRVPSRRRLEAHPSVFHTVADVTGRLADGRTAIDLLAACFPAGSVTGVPKIRALEIIAELEPTPRGAYTGAIGRLGMNGDATFSVAIRTLQLHGGSGYLHVGGGIVAESDAAAEYEETLAKSAGILRSLGLDARADCARKR